MQIVIELYDNDYGTIKELGFIPIEISEDIARAIINGTPLPKGHGRLKDIDAFITKVKADRKHSAYLRSWTADDVLSALDNSYAPTIIEAEGSDPE